MEEPVKQAVSIFIGLLCAFFILTVMTFGIAVYNARSVLYTVIDYVEIAGPNAGVISDYAEETHTAITVTPTGDNGIYSSGTKNRYTVEVTFSHTFAWLKFSPDFTLKGTTRAVDY